MLLRDAKTQYHTTWLVRRVNKQLKNHTLLYSCHLSEVIQHQTELELKNCHVLGQADIGQKGYSKLSSIVLIYCKSIFQRPCMGQASSFNTTLDTHNDNFYLLSTDFKTTGHIQLVPYNCYILSLSLVCNTDTMIVCARGLTM